jgi:hypothetical protein
MPLNGCIYKAMNGTCIYPILWECGAEAEASGHACLVEGTDACNLFGGGREGE